MTMGISGPAILRISLEQMALRIEFAFRTHRPVQRYVNPVDVMQAHAYRLKNFRRQSLPIVSRQKARAARMGADDRNDGDARFGIEHRERPADRGVQASFDIKLLPSLEVEVLVMRRQRVERRNFLHALGYQDFGHGVFVTSGVQTIGGKRSVDSPMARDKASVGNGHQRWIQSSTAILHERTPGGKTASGRDVVRAGEISHQFMPVARLVGMRGWDRRQQRLRIGMCRRCEQTIRSCDLDNAAEIHDRNAIGDVAHDREIVRNEQIGELQLPLEILQQVDDLRLNRDVERRHRFVAHHEAGPQGKGPRDTDPLPLAAGEFMGVALRCGSRQTNKVQHLQNRLALGTLGRRSRE